MASSTSRSRSRPPRRCGPSGRRPATAARKEGKTPVLMLYAKGKPGGLVVCHTADLAKVAAELAGPGADT